MGYLPNNSYGAFIEGYFVPPIDGEYTFHIASDDHFELHFSETPDVKDNLVNIYSY